MHPISESAYKYGAAPLFELATCKRAKATLLLDDTLQYRELNPCCHGDVETMKSSFAALLAFLSLVGPTHAQSDSGQIGILFQRGRYMPIPMGTLIISVCSIFLACAILPISAISQQDASSSQRQTEDTIEGTIVSSSRDTVVVRTEDNQFHLFVFGPDTSKPRSIPNGARVRVVSTPGEEAGTRLASTITNIDANTKTPQNNAPDQAQPIPPAVRNVEHDIKRQARRWRIGVRAGASLDPELILFGVHSQIGPIFSRDVFFRPNAEFAFGEVTDLVALNPEAIYRLRVASRGSAWAPYYLGAGPNLTFLHQSFQTKPGQGREIDFSNLDFNAGFNILAGVQFRRGTFFEIKTSIYSQPAPVLRLIVGYNF